MFLTILALSVRPLCILESTNDSCSLFLFNHRATATTVSPSVSNFPLLPKRRSLQNPFNALPCLHFFSPINSQVLHSYFHCGNICHSYCFCFLKICLLPSLWSWYFYIFLLLLHRCNSSSWRLAQVFPPSFSFSRFVHPSPKNLLFLNSPRMCYFIFVEL
jgi:hypothetical protein